jgi:hypothetical protein
MTKNPLIEKHNLYCTQSGITLLLKKHTFGICISNGNGRLPLGWERGSKGQNRERERALFVKLSHV